jgi:hypothetical protein
MTLRGAWMGWSPHKPATSLVGALFGLPWKDTPQMALPPLVCA